jgi:signal transduction histidine kinase
MLPKLIMQSRKSVERVGVLIDDLLNVARLKEHQLSLNKSTFILSQLINACANPVSIGSNKHITVSGDVELEVTADEHRIDQVLTNFLSNAVKYAPDSETIEITLQKQDQYVKVMVTDHGHGIPAEKLQHLFDRYYRVDNTMQHVSGLGLGLYISAEIIQRHGGEIGANSVLGHGSTFWFTLPL